MESKFFDSLFEGDSANGFKLCMGLTSGDFWARPAGTQNLYRSQNADTVDFETIVAVADIDDNNITVPGITEHNSSSYYVYIIRRTNCYGDEEHTLSAAIRASFDANGDLTQPATNKIFSVKSEQIETNKVQLTWFYWPINQAKQITKFKIYSDNGSGTIDYENTITEINYVGRKFYEYTTDTLANDNNKFCIRAIASDGMEDNWFNEIMIQLNKQQPDSADILQTTII